jgi:hypothetical protein
MKNDNQAALDLFSNYSEFMLTDDELLAIHGGDSPAAAPATSSPASAPSAPPAAPQAPPPQAPAAPPNLSPANVSVGVTVDFTPAVTDFERQVSHSDSAGALDTLVTHAIEAVDNFFFGPSTPSAPPATGGAGGAHGGGGGGGSGG